MTELTSAFRSLGKQLASLKLAVFVIVGLASSLAAATFIESLYDTRTAQYWIYRSPWFAALLLLLGINILASALSRLPWKPRHLPFLLAHVGILTLLTGSFLTQKYGLDGSLRVSEGEATSVVELEDMALIILDGVNATRVPIPWIPPEVEFKKLSLKSRGYPYDLTIDQYMTHAQPNYNFIPAAVSAMAKPAVKLQLQGGRMAIKQDFWLWGGDPSWASVQAGPASLILAPEDTSISKIDVPKGRPSLIVQAEKDGKIHYLAISSDGKKVAGHLSAKQAEGYTLDPSWRGGVKIIFEKSLSKALPQTTFTPSRVQHGTEAPPSAIHLVSGHGGEGSELWLGMGERAALDVGGKSVEIGYFPERVILPFQVKLDQFTVDHYDGTNSPSSYSSRVSVLDAKGEHSALISMNEPLTQMGTTLYQASYEEAMPRPVTSILSVNRDPGRVWKYIGSILIVLGSILLFARKYWGKA